MAYIHWGRLKFFRNGISMLQMTALLCWKFLKNLTTGLNKWEMRYISGKWLKYLRNGKNIWEMTLICGKWLKYMKNGLSI